MKLSHVAIVTDRGRSLLRGRLGVFSGLPTSASATTTPPPT